MNGLWQISTGSSQIRVAVLDTGIDDSHSDLSGQVAAETNIATSGKPSDSHGHGTHIAGIIAAKDNNNGIIGIAPNCELLNVKVADDMGRCQASDLAEGIVWAVDNGADVINVSIEIREPYSKLEKAINYAWEQGSLVVAAAGNGGSESPVYPARYENCLAVSATDSNHDLTTLSNHGDWVDLAAPGSKIYSTLPEEKYGYKSGTSFACAHISGIAALLFDITSDANDNGRINDEVAETLKSSCQNINLSGIGNGLINATLTLSHLP
jgi:thermitase